MAEILRRPDGVRIRPAGQPPENTWHGQEAYIKEELEAGRALDFNGLTAMGKQVAMSLEATGHAKREEREGRPVICKGSFLRRLFSPGGYLGTARS